MGAMMIKLQDSGDRFGVYLCLHCTYLLCTTLHYQFTDTQVTQATRPTTKISRSIFDDDERESRSEGCSTFFEKNKIFVSGAAVCGRFACMLTFVCGCDDGVYAYEIAGVE